MFGLHEAGLTRTRRWLATPSLGGLAAGQGIVGAWALTAPAHFYAGFLVQLAAVATAFAARRTRTDASSRAAETVGA